MSQFQVVHSLPGRTRIRLKTQISHPGLLEANIRAHPRVHSACYRAETKSLLIHHNDSMSCLEVSKMLLRLVSRKPILTEHSSRGTNYKSYFLLSGVGLLWNWMFPTTAARLLSVPSLITMFLSRSTFKNGLLTLIKRRKANADTLSSVAIIASLIKGTPQSAILILMISAFSEMLTDLTASRARRSLSELMEGEVRTAWKVVNSETVKVSINELRVEDEIFVFAGEKVPVDGTVLSGSGSIDESSITGEYLPKSVEPGGYVFAGSVLKEGCLLIRAERVGDQSAVRKMIKLIEESYNQKAPVQHLTDRLASRLVIVSFLMAGFVFMFTRNWDRTLNMLIVDFCCGLKLSTSTAFSVSIAKAAQNGILIKGSQHIEKLTAIDTVILDKTGTITEGKPEVLNIYGVEPGMEKQVLMYAASVEKHSGHPVAEAIRREAMREKIHIMEPVDVETIVGKGISATVKGHRILIGSKRFLRENFIEVQNEPNEIEGTPIYVAKQGALLGVVYIQDRIRSNMQKCLSELKEKYIRNIMMVTGDQRQSAMLVSKQMGIKDYIFEALPEQKHLIVRQLQRSGRNVLMIGDGLNDGPALGRADVGVSMGSKRTALASEVSDITITSDDPILLPALMELSHKTMGAVRNNIRFTIALNAFALILGAMGILSPVLSAIIHNGATVAVVANSSRLLWLDMKHFRSTPRVIDVGRAKVTRLYNGESEKLRSVVGL